MRIGLDIGGTKTDAVLIDASMTVRHRVQQPTGRGHAAVLDGAERVVRQLLHEAGVTPAEIQQLGIGIPGFVDDVTGDVRHAVNLGLTELQLARVLSARLGIAVLVENDVNAAALGATRLLYLDAPTAFLNLGTGLAAGVVVGGQIWRGARGGAGEIGHIPVDPLGAMCSCGQRGCLETVASGAALARLWPTAAALPAVDLFDRADAGEPEAVAVRDTLVVGVASAVRLLLLSTDVDVVVVGGGLSNLGERLLAPLLATLTAWGRESPFLSSLDMAGRVRLLPQGAPAAAIGAALLGSTPVPAVV